MSDTTASDTATSASRSRSTSKFDKATDKAIGWLDDRLGVGKGRSLLDKIFPDHWSFLLGEIALYSFIVLVLTGIFLSLYFVPSTHEIVYHGPYAPLRGKLVSEAYASTLRISFSVRGGLVIRQMHHWAADVFVGAIAIHMMRIFFTGAFRKPRELNWMVGVTLLMLAIVNGFLGYSLPYDLVSGTGLRIAYSIILSIPLVGSYLAFFLFGGIFPGNGSIEPRMFILHVLVVPIIIAALIGAHLFMLIRQKHTHFPGKGRTEDNVVGSPLYPTFMAKTLGLFFIVTGVLWLLGGLVQINPIWQFGPYEPYKITYAVQPDWYMGWLDGALRIMPSWEFTGFGHTIPLEIFLPAILFPGITFTLFYAWPFIEAKITKDYAVHNILDFPRYRPKRTALGAAGVAFYFTLFAASSTDVLANFFQVSLNTVLWSFRILVIAVPVVVGLVTYQICKELATVPISDEPKRSVIITRTDEGSYEMEEADIRPGDETDELSPIPVPVRISTDDSVDGDTASDYLGEVPGVRRVPR
jgi:ubiquinol-cytochrome c reductase cytochrome b subunit